jgi:imidazoleglycerol-phosphate dehydratase/histidinol-phosphatase
MAKRILFVDRDGTIVREPADFQIDSIEKVDFLPYVIPSLKRLVEAGFELVMVTNQDGMGTEHFPIERFLIGQNYILDTLKADGITFLEICVDNHFPEDNHPNRKPNTGLVAPLLANTEIDLAHSYMVGDRSTDALFAKNIGCQSITIRDSKSADGEVRVTADEKAKTQLAPTHTVHSWVELADYVLARTPAQEPV